MGIFLFILLIIASAFFSGSETAFLSLGKIRFKQIEAMRHPAAKRVVSLLDDPNKLLVTVLIGNTCVNIAASALASYFFYGLFGEKGVAFSIISMTLIILVFGEVTPKRFALSNAVNFSFFSSLPINWLQRLFKPIRTVLTNISITIVKTMGLNVRSEKPRITEEEIRSLFIIGKEWGILKKKEMDMVENILEFKELNAADIMTPRIDIQALDISTDREDISREIRDAKLSRFPVYIHTLDNIVGVIHSKDFLLNPEAPVKSMIKKPHFVHESKRIDDLLQELQRHHTHMAIITDEYGVTSGLVTIEDLLEEIVGEISDEFDTEISNITKVDRKNFEVRGQTHIDEVNKKLDLSIKTDEVDTIGGYITLIMGKIPQSGDSIDVNGATITVNDVSKNRITSLMITLKEQ